MGTGITTGPFTLTAGQTLSFNDPATWSVNSANVQIQNNTGFNIYVQSAGGGYNIQPFTASTIPCAGGQTLVGVVSSTANVQTGFLSAVWLLPGQTPPMPDGPMTIYPKTISAITVVSQSHSSPPSYWVLSGYPVTNSSITIYWTSGGNWPPYTYIWLDTGLNTYSAYIGTPGGSASSLTFSGISLTNTTQCFLYYGTGSSSVNYVGSQYWAGPYLLGLTATSST